jgi:hypothetical protein
MATTSEEYAESDLADVVLQDSPAKMALIEEADENTLLQGTNGNVLC